METIASRNHASPPAIAFAAGTAQSPRALRRRRGGRRGARVARLLGHEGSPRGSAARTIAMRDKRASDETRTPLLVSRTTSTVLGWLAAVGCFCASAPGRRPAEAEAATMWPPGRQRRTVKGARTCPCLRSNWAVRGGSERRLEASARRRLTARAAASQRRVPCSRSSSFPRRPRRALRFGNREETAASRSEQRLQALLS
jgi:hypothetical protein